jgi:di/tripeptidase
MNKIVRTFKDSEAYSEDGGKTWRWCSNNSVIMLDVCKSHGIPCDIKAQEAAREKYLDEVFANYKKNQPATPSLEEQYEMRAAFGPGKDVVDVVSGRRWRT